MLCTKCGGAVVTRIFADFRSDQERVWFWALRCNRCDHLVDAGLKPDGHSCTSTRKDPWQKSPFTN